MAYSDVLIKDAVLNIWAVPGKVFTSFYFNHKLFLGDRSGPAKTSPTRLEWDFSFCNVTVISIPATSVQVCLKCQWKEREKGSDQTTLTRTWGNRAWHLLDLNLSPRSSHCDAAVKSFVKENMAGEIDHHERPTELDGGGQTAVETSQRNQWWPQTTWALIQSDGREIKRRARW